MTQSPPDWLITRQAVDAIGVSDETLAKWRRSGLLQPGIHYRRKSAAPKSPVLYHWQRCIEANAAASARNPATLELTT